MTLATATGWGEGLKISDLMKVVEVIFDGVGRSYGFSLHESRHRGCEHCIIFVTQDTTM